MHKTKYTYQTVSLRSCFLVSGSNVPGALRTLYEQCSTDSSNRLNVTATNKYEKIKKLMFSNILS